MTRTREEWIKICETIDGGFVPSSGKSSIYDSGVEYVSNYLMANDALEPRARVVDVGCGNGRLAMGLVDQHDVQYHGFDVVRESVAFCRRAFEGVYGFHFTHMNVRNARYNPNGLQTGRDMVLPLQDDWATLIVASSLFTHIGDLRVVRRYLSEMRRVLRPGGKMLTTWFRSPPNRVSSNEARVVQTQKTIRQLLEPDEIIWQHGGASRDHHDQWMILTVK